jgi:hypothetical protein
MAEVKLNPKGKGSGGACYRDEDMSPPACHDHLPKQCLALGLVDCRVIRRWSRDQRAGAQHRALNPTSSTVSKMNESDPITYCVKR